MIIYKRQFYRIRINNKIYKRKYKNKMKLFFSKKNKLKKIKLNKKKIKFKSYKNNKKSFKSKNQ